MVVKVSKLPGNGTVLEIEIQEGMTVEDAIRAGNFDYSGFEVRLNGQPTEMNARVSGGDLILLLQKLKGN